MNRRDFMTVDELSQYLKVPRSWIYDKTHRDILPCYRLGKLLRFDLDEIEHWLESKKDGPDIKIHNLKVLDKAEVKYDE